jgi:hypothetical protein
MAHFAQLDENNVVLQVIVVHNNELMIDGIESEDAGIVFCKTLFGESTSWKQTSYNASIRKNYAGIGYVYDKTRDAFVSPSPYPSWTLNETTCQWDAPAACPTDGQQYNWDEPTLSWVVIPATQE